MSEIRGSGARVFTAREGSEEWVELPGVKSFVVKDGLGRVVAEYTSDPDDEGSVAVPTARRDSEALLAPEDDPFWTQEEPVPTVLEWARDWAE